MHFKNRENEYYNSFGFETENFHNSNLNQNRFHAIYFIDYETGSLLLSNKYSKKSNICNADEDLIGSFLNAINLFINELNKNDKTEETIQEINFIDTRILYERKGRLMVIGISKKTNLSIERKILKNILFDFYSRFKKKIEHFNGIIDKEMLNYGKFLNDLNLNTLSRIKIYEKI
ncbi:MAG: hypothetical protein KGD63_02585 [Candidatus Lokiarchaeota archaeon]|nr:hypothetical protein [Candidatus Lokiarchaeota archaeon]